MLAAWSAFAKATARQALSPFQDLNSYRSRRSRPVTAFSAFGWQRSCMMMKENALGNTTLRADLQVEETRAELRRN
jgi:hypothetical protein